MSKIPIKALKELSKAHGLDHVIIFATGDKTMYVATYGRTIDECSEAADFGNKLKDALGWPESLHQQPARVRKLQARTKQLEQFIKDVGYSMDDVEAANNLTNPTAESEKVE